MKPSINFLLTQSIECPSGLGRYWPMAKELAARGYTVSILALHPDYFRLPPQERSFQRDGVYVHYVWQMHVLKRDGYKYHFPLLKLGWHLLQATLRLGWHSLRSRAELFYVGKPHPMNVLPALGQRLRGRRIIVDYDDIESEINQASGLQRAIVHLFEVHAHRIAHQVITHNAHLRQWLIQLGVPPRKIALIPNGIEDSRFPPLSTQEVESLREQLGLQGKKIVLYLGSLDLKSHPVDLLLEAFPQVIKHVPQAFLLIVGGGRDRDRIIQMIHQLHLTKHARVIGPVPSKEAPLYYQLAYVSIDPVRDDPIATMRFPLKIIESFACGVPVITGDVGERRPLITRYDSGILVVPGEAKSLSEAIVALLQDEERRQRLAENARHTAQHYLWSHLAEQLAIIIEKTARTSCVSSS